MTGALLVVIEYFNPATFKIYGLTEKQKKKLKKKDTGLQCIHNMFVNAKGRDPKLYTKLDSCPLKN